MTTIILPIMIICGMLLEMMPAKRLRSLRRAAPPEARSSPVHQDRREERETHKREPKASFHDGICLFCVEVVGPKKKDSFFEKKECERSDWRAGGRPDHADKGCLGQRFTCALSSVAFGKVLGVAW